MFFHSRVFEKLLRRAAFCRAVLHRAIESRRFLLLIFEFRDHSIRVFHDYPIVSA